MSLIQRLFRKVDQFFYDIQFVEQTRGDDAEILVIAYGCVARSAHLAVLQAREKGIKAGLLKLKTLFPFPRPALEKLMQLCRTLVVPEMNMGQMSREMKRVNNGRANVRTLNRVDGQIITPSQILKLLQKV